MATRYRRIRRLVPRRLQLDHHAARAIEDAVARTREAIVAATLDAIEIENRRRYRHSPPIRRVLPRHVERAVERLNISLGKGKAAYIRSLGDGSSGETDA